MWARHIKWASAQRTGSILANATLVHIAIQASKEGYCTVTIDSISYAVEASKRATYTALDTLEKRGFITRESRRKKGKQLPNVVHIMTPQAEPRKPAEPLKPAENDALIDGNIKPGAADAPGFSTHKPSNGAASSDGNIKPGAADAPGFGRIGNDCDKTGSKQAKPGAADAPGFVNHTLYCLKSKSTTNITPSISPAEENSPSTGTRSSFTLTANDGKKPARDTTENPESGFDDWWSVYPKKVKKKQARKLWATRKLFKIASTLIDDTIAKVAQDDGWRRGYSPDPVTYINGDRWDDAITQPMQRKPKTPQEARKLAQAEQGASQHAGDAPGAGKGIVINQDGSEWIPPASQEVNPLVDLIYQNGRTRH